MRVQIGLGGLLFLLFLTLRLTDQINWAWYWVAAPLWVLLGLGLGIAAIAGIIAILVGSSSSNSAKRG